jgi:hypothetical protein
MATPKKSVSRWFAEKESNLRSFGYQPSALPLSYLRIELGIPGGIRTPDLRFWRPLLCQLSYRDMDDKCGAGIEVRTRGLDVGNVALCQLSYTRVKVLIGVRYGIRTRVLTLKE